MKRMSIAVAALLLLATSIHADIVIFSVTSTNRVLGIGQAYNVIGYGRTVVDVETGFRVSIGWFTLNGQKYFSINRSNRTWPASAFRAV